MKIITVIPYFGGASIDADKLHNRKRDSASVRFNHLKKVILNQSTFNTEIFVVVCSEQDMKSLSEFSVKTILVQSEPKFLPATAMNEIKKIKFDAIYYTESDQILHSTSWDELLSLCDDSTFIIPRRFIQKNSSLEAQNKEPEGEMYKSKYLIDKNQFRIFGGAWLCSRVFFEKIEFLKHEYMPIEHTSCFDLFSVPNSKGIVTKNPFDFWVNHLSGRQYKLLL